MTGFLVDSHAHLDDPRLSGQLHQVLTRAGEAGVSAILTIGCIREKDGLERLLQLVQDHPQVYAAVGVHPHDAHTYSREIEEWLGEAAAHPKVLAWGEIGLDYFYEHSSRDRQVEVFKLQLRAARRASKPIIIHMRDSESDILKLLRAEDPGQAGGVFHCFTAGWETAEQALDLGFFISLGGILTFPKSEELRRTAARIPLDRLLIETDSPYLAPVPFRGKTNEPSRVRLVAEVLAEIRGRSVEEIGETTTRNFERLFGVRLG